MSVVKFTIVVHQNPGSDPHKNQFGCTTMNLSYLKGLSHEIDFKNVDKNLQN
jgi:hypothetical protein